MVQPLRASDVGRNRADVIEFRSLEADDNGLLLRQAKEDLLDGKHWEARKKLNRLIEDGVDDAYFYLGHSYEIYPGKDSAQSYEAAYFYYQKAIETVGSVEAHLGIARFFVNGVFGQVDCEKALAIYLELIEQDVFVHGFVFWRIGRMYISGQGVDADLGLAEDYFQKGWALKHIPSLGWLGVTLQRRGRVSAGLFYRIRAAILALVEDLMVDDSPRTRMDLESYLNRKVG